MQGSTGRQSRAESPTPRLRSSHQGKGVGDLARPSDCDYSWAEAISVVSRAFRIGLLIAAAAALLTACTSSTPRGDALYPKAPEFEAFVAAHGGVDTFGAPIEPPRKDGQQVRQAFANAELVYEPALPDGERVSLTTLGYSLGLATPAVVRPQSDAAYFESTGHVLDPRLHAGYEAIGGQAVAGAPIAEAVLRDGYVVQYFEALGMRLRAEAPADEVQFLAYGYAAREAIRVPAGVVLPPDARSRPFALFLDPYGGEAVFGRALTGPYAAADGALEQVFANVVLYAASDSPGSIRLRPLGAALGAADPPVTGPSDTVGLYIPQSGHYVLWAFVNFFRAHGAEAVLGLPLEEGKTTDGVLRQRFENVILEYRPDLPPHLAVQLAPLGVDYAANGMQANATPVAAATAAPAPPACEGVASVITQAELAILPAGGLQRLSVQVKRPDGSSWAGITPIVVVHAPAGDLYPVVPPTNAEGETAASLSVDGLRTGEIVNFEVVVAAEQCTGYAIGQFAGGL
jgi:hypothetical protein